MNQQRLWFELDRVASRFRLLRFWLALAAAWLIAAGAGLAIFGLRASFAPPASVAVLLVCLVAGALAVAGIWLAATSARSYEWVARRIEASYPELRTCLLAAVEQRPDLPGGRYGYLQSSVIHQALYHADRNAWTQVVPMKRILAAAAANVLTFAMFVGVLGLIAMTVGPAARNAAALASAAAASITPGKTFTVAVEPGNTAVERGTSLLVLARVTGPMPAEATLVFVSADGEESRLPMSPSLDDPVFGGRIPLVEAPVDYRVELGGQITPTYHVTVFEYPRLEKADARLVFPAYTKQAEKLVQDMRTVSVVEGTDLTLMCYLNKAVVSATLSEDKQPPIAMTAATPPAPPADEKVDAKKPSRRTQYFYTAQIKCEKSRKLKLELIDDAGRKNVKPVTFTINVLPNQPASLKPTFPARDLEVSALEELDVKATVYDDFGVVRVGLTYSINGQPPVDVVVMENGVAKQKHELAQQVKLEELKAEPDQLLSYHWWAEDNAADGSVRRTMGDMYFAEVRPFEEIFRQGQQPAGGEQQQREQQQRQQGQGQNARDAQQLAQLQKDIINATWKLIRRETGSKPTDAFKSDAEQVRTSQESAIEQASALGERLTDEQSQEHLENVILSMGKAVELLKQAEETPTAAPLTPSMAAEQAAYQSLLKLRAREHEVVRQQQRQQRGQQQQQQRNARSQQQQQQLNQLELRNDQNRYQTQRAAQAQQQQETPEERENRQVLNRLKELARRQHDLNERVKEMQSALEEAKTEAQKEEIRQQLKRLQDEQQQILQDTDELQNRMDAPENQERMTEERQQLEQTREQVRRAAEALNQEQVTQAAASGTRAEQEFEDLRNEFRRRASGRFNEEMRQMREAAKELDEKQQDLTQRLDQEQQPNQKTKSLRDTGEREKIAEDLAQQRQRLGNLQERMRETITQAEETEPLLSERLYDTDRNLQQQAPERALESAERSLRQGLVNDARQQQQPAGESIRQLRQGIDRAAEAVLGDETEALRRARQALQDLSRELNDEINRNNPNRQPQEGQEGQEGQPQEGQPGQKGQKGEKGEGQKGEGQKGEGQKGQGQKGQKGEGQQGQKGQGQKGQKGQGGQAGENQEGQPQEGQPQEGQVGQGQKGQGQKGQNGEGQPGQKGQGQKGQKGQGGKGGGQPGENQEGQPQEGQPQEGQAQEGQPQEGQPGQKGGKAGQRGGKTGQRGGQRRLTDGGPQTGGGNIEDFNRRDFSPLTGGDFREWSDRLRDVEEMVEDPELRAEAARIRERARSIRAEAQRHSADPNWELVQQQVAGPLVTLRDRVAEELLRRTSQQAIVPLDRDPVPPQFSEKTRRYYERLGTGSSGAQPADGKAAP